MTPAMAAQVEALRKANNHTPRITVTELARSRKWREDVYEYGVVEISERNEPCAYLLSPDGLSALLGTIDQLEEELERASLRAILETRPEEEAHWVQGGTAEAQRAIGECFDGVSAYVGEALDGR